MLYRSCYNEDKWEQKQTCWEWTANMGAERLVINDEGRSHHLPPLEAWKQPDKWLNLRSGTVRDGIEKPRLPIDDRQFILPDQAVRFVIDTFFWEDYNWPYDPEDKETAPDDHHFYYYKRNYKPGVNNGSLAPSEFRSLPTSIGRMPRQLHNTFHSLTRTPNRPKLRYMEEYLASYELAVSAFQKSFHHMNRLIRRPNVIPFNPAMIDELPRMLDPIAEAFIDGFFRHHFASYSGAIDQVHGIVESAPEGTHIFENAQVVEFTRALGDAASRQFINFTPELQQAA